ncbi:MAG: hypothetical protein KGY40_05185 [Thioalkalivibrio sp.]|nr:hypothetical protein [Thioalkalivibrio sp.]
MADPSTPATGGPLPIQHLAAWGLRGVALLTALAGILASITFWALAWQTPEWSWPLTALVLLQILFAAALVTWVVLLWQRARLIGTLRARDYPAITCVALCMRLMGELLATGFVWFSLALSVTSLTTVDPFASSVVMALDLEAELVEPATWVLAGTVALAWPLGGLFAGAMILFAAYLFAEALTAMLEYIRDIRRIREALSTQTERNAEDSRRAAPGSDGNRS